jgi:HipA-like protein
LSFFSTELGRVRNDAGGRLSFVYGDDWRQSLEAYPLSLSMPLAAKERGRSVVEAFLWGLLPDNERVLDRWAAKFQVSARNVFALISRVGEDCAGAVQFVTLDKSPLFRAALGRTGLLNGEAMHRIDAYRMIQRRAAELGMKVKIGCHTFRATGITAYIEAGRTLENAQMRAAHESPRTTKLYDRTGDEITLDEVERITI